MRNSKYQRNNTLLTRGLEEKKQNKKIKNKAYGNGHLCK